MVSGGAQPSEWPRDHTVTSNGVLKYTMRGFTLEGEEVLVCEQLKRKRNK